MNLRLHNLDSRAMLSSLLLLFITLTSHYRLINSSNSADIDNLMSQGIAAMAGGEMERALSNFDSVINLDPNNYIALYRRATLFLSLSRSRQALPDLNKVLSLKPTLHHARYQRASLLVRQGKLNEAEEDVNLLMATEFEGSAELQEKINLVKSFKTSLDEMYAIGQLNLENTLTTMSSILEISPWDISTLFRRADLNEQIGSLGNAIPDLRVASSFLPGDTEVLYKLTKLYYITGDLEQTLNTVRECLRLDQDHKECFKQYKKAKKLNKHFMKVEEYINGGQENEAINELNECIETEPEVKHHLIQTKSKLCHCYNKLNLLSETKKWCDETLELDPEHVDALCNRAEQYIANELYDEAIKDYQKAKDINAHFQRADEGLQRAQKLMKQSQKRDYYKILGIKRNADKRQITKAYRNMAQQWHPDKYPDPIEKERAEKKFIDIAAAKEVLTDPEKRQKFDNGDDPLDPEQQNQGWHQGPHGFPFGGHGGGFTFKFHF